MVRAWHSDGQGSPWTPLDEEQPGGPHAPGDQAPSSVLILSDGAPEDLPALLALVTMARSLGGAATRIAAGSSHPTREIVEALRQRGADDVLLVTGPLAPPDRQGPGTSRVPIAGSPCPYLGVRSGPAGLSSVCGRMGDRLFVARDHLRSLCLADFAACPWFADLPDGPGSGPCGVTAA